MGRGREGRGGRGEEGSRGEGKGKVVPSNVRDALTPLNFKPVYVHWVKIQHLNHPVAAAPAAC